MSNWVKKVKNSLPDYCADLSRKIKSAALATSPNSNQEKQINHQQKVTRDLKLEEMLRSGQYMKGKSWWLVAETEHTSSVIISWQAHLTRPRTLIAQQPDAELPTAQTACQWPWLVPLHRVHFCGLEDAVWLRSQPSHLTQPSSLHHKALTMANMSFLHWPKQGGGQPLNIK